MIHVSACNYGHHAILLLDLFNTLHNLPFPTFIYHQKAQKLIKQPPPSPPSPPALPLIGHLLSLTVHKSLTKISSKYGPLLHLRIGSMSCIHVSSDSIATEIFKTFDFNLSFLPKSAFRDSILFGDSGFIAAAYGDYWKFMKKLCVTELLGMRHVERSRSVRREEIMQLLRKVLRKASDNEVVDVGSELGKLAFTVLYRMVTGAAFSEETSDQAESHLCSLPSCYLLRH